MVLSKTAEKEKPKRPPNQYFIFRDKRLAEMDPNDKNKSKKIKLEYDDLDEKTRKHLDNQAQELREQYQKEMKEWKKKYGIDDDDDNKSQRSKSKKNKDKDGTSKEKGSKASRGASKSKDTKSDKSKPKKK